MTSLPPLPPLPPWHATHSLDPSGVTVVLQDQFPELTIQDVRFLEQGWDSQAFLVNETWVFRFPKRAEVVPHLLSEIAVLPLLAAALPVPIPEFRFVGQPSPRFELPFAGYRMIPGVQADSVSADDCDADALLDQLLAILHALHALPVEGPIAAVTAWESEASTEPGPYTARLGLQEEPAIRDALVWLDSIPVPESARRVLRHDDLGFEHVLLDPTTSRITGLIDWGDMSLGDPAVDLVGALRWAGLTRTRAALERAGTASDPGLLDRTLSALVQNAVSGWCQGVEFEEPGEVARARQTLATFLP